MKCLILFFFLFAFFASCLFLLFFLYLFYYVICYITVMICVFLTTFFMLFHFRFVVFCLLRACVLGTIKKNSVLICYKYNIYCKQIRKNNKKRYKYTNKWLDTIWGVFKYLISLSACFSR